VLYLAARFETLWQINARRIRIQAVRQTGPLLRDRTWGPHCLIGNLLTIRHTNIAIATSHTASRPATPHAANGTMYGTIEVADP
jgi:hypothetical protein